MPVRVYDTGTNKTHRSPCKRIRNTKYLDFYFLFYFKRCCCRVVDDGLQLVVVLAFPLAIETVSNIQVVHDFLVWANKFLASARKTISAFCLEQESAFRLPQCNFHNTTAQVCRSNA
jgi:hypothetical protein